MPPDYDGTRYEQLVALRQASLTVEEHMQKFIYLVCAATLHVIYQILFLFKMGLEQKIL